MHPYRMQRLIKERGKDLVINVRQHASIYQTIERLERAGLIAVQGTARAERRPERTTYALTEAGDEAARTWLREMLSTPARQFPEFPAALAFLPLLAPEEVLRQFEARIAALEAERARAEAELAGSADWLPRLFLLETEYMHAAREAELAWVRAVADDLRAGRLTWNAEWLRALAASLTAPDATEGSET